MVANITKLNCTRQKRDIPTRTVPLHVRVADIKQLLDEVEHDIMNYQNLGLCYLPKPKAEADNTDTKF